MSALRTTPTSTERFSPYPIPQYPQPSYGAPVDSYPSPYPAYPSPGAYGSNTSGYPSGYPTTGYPSSTFPASGAPQYPTSASYPTTTAASTTSTQTGISPQQPYPMNYPQGYGSGYPAAYGSYPQLQSTPSRYGGYQQQYDASQLSVAETKSTSTFKRERNSDIDEDQAKIKRDFDSHLLSAPSEAGMCARHQKQRSNKCLEYDPIIGGYVCKPSLLCKGKGDGAATLADDMERCAVHGKMRKRAYLQLNPDGSYACKGHQQCKAI